MSPLLVLASARSRLQADLLQLQLRRVGLARRKILTLGSDHPTPSALAHWLDTNGDEGSPEPLEMMGANENSRVPKKKRSVFRATAALLVEAGVDRADTRVLERELKAGHLLLAVSAANEDEASVAWHVFKNAPVPFIAVGTLPSRAALTATPAPEDDVLVPVLAMLAV
jgi:hypothetical protein